MQEMQKIQLKLFDGRRNQNFWFHFCYVPKQLWLQYAERFKVANMDAQVKAWLKQDFGFEVIHMDDIYKAKEHIKQLYAEVYPDVFLENDGDRQGWSRVWLTEKIKHMLEVE